MRNSWNQQMLTAAAAGKTLVGTARSDYPGEVVEHLPRTDVVGGKPTSNPDFYAWHVVGRPDHARLNVHHVEVRSGA